MQQLGGRCTAEQIRVGAASLVQAGVMALTDTQEHGKNRKHIFMALWERCKVECGCAGTGSGTGKLPASWGHQQVSGMQLPTARQPCVKNLDTRTRNAHWAGPHTERSRLCRRSRWGQQRY